jgi:hypothetical protein
MKLQKTQKVDGFYFEYVEEHSFYQCRGKIMYDNEHDEMPEPELWEAAHKLKTILEKKGFECEVEHSEKGWVSVDILNN